jgi:hypothetical protein
MVMCPDADDVTWFHIICTILVDVNPSVLNVEFPCLSVNSVNQHAIGEALFCCLNLWNSVVRGVACCRSVLNHSVFFRICSIEASINI